MKLLFAFCGEFFYFRQQIKIIYMKVIKFLSVVLVVLVLHSCNKKGGTNKPLKTQLDSVSYAIGMTVAGQVNKDISEIDRELFNQGFVNSLDSMNILLDQKALSNVLQSYFNKKNEIKRKEAQAKQIKETEEKFSDNKVISEDFLEENRTKEGVQTTASGLQYIVLKVGTGEKPESASTIVKVHYHGTNLDGEVFDSSVDKGVPYETALNRVIPGWTEGVQLMSVGAKYKFFIPQNLAYGARGSGAKIKPFSAIIFEVELLDIIKK